MVLYNGDIIRMYLGKILQHAYALKQSSLYWLSKKHLLLLQNNKGSLQNCSYTEAILSTKFDYVTRLSIYNPKIGVFVKIWKQIIDTMGKA